MHICIMEFLFIGLCNGLAYVQHQAFTWTNAASLSIGPLGMDSIEIEGHYTIGAC